MDKEQILEKSRREYKNYDWAEQEALRLGTKAAMLAGLGVAFLLFTVQTFSGGGTNWGIFAIVFAFNCALFTVKAWKLRRKWDIILAVVNLAFVVTASVRHILALVNR